MGEVLSRVDFQPIGKLHASSPTLIHYAVFETRSKNNAVHRVLAVRSSEGRL